MNSERWERRLLAAGALLAGLAVVAGAFGAHALKSRLSVEALASWETAARYQMYHALALLLLARWEDRRTTVLVAAAWCFIVGIVLFSGSLYVLAVTGQRWAGAITPLGGVLFIAGWACVASAALRPETA